MGEQRHGAAIVWFVYLLVLGLGMFLSGLLIPSADPVYVYAGGLIVALSFILLFVAFGLWRLRVFWLFVTAWFAGVFVQAILFNNGGLFICCALALLGDTKWVWRNAWSVQFIPGEILCVMFSTILVHGPLLLLTCHLYKAYERRLRQRIWLLLSASFLLAVFLPFYTCVQLTKEYPRVAEEIRVSSDQVADKTPAFVDRPAMWQVSNLTDTVQERINKSAAVVGMDLGKYSEEERPLGARLFPTYDTALKYADERKLRVLPSFQMVDHRSKQFADKLYAAVEAFVQESESAPGGGKKKFLSDLLQILLSKQDGTLPSIQAAAIVAAGLTVGGNPAPGLPDNVESNRAEMQRAFLDSPLHAKPVSFYAENELLSRIFLQDRFLQANMAPATAVSLARALDSDPELRQTYLKVLALNSRITNPASRFSLADVVDYPQYYGNPNRLVEELLKSEKGKRFAVFWPEHDHILFFPQSMAKENVLFAKLYGSLGFLPPENTMGVLIEHIRSGKINLTPDPDSGWYDYQAHALEPLLLPEKAEDAKKLYLTADYKKLRIEAFRTVMTKNRELHAKLLRECFTIGVSIEPKSRDISPELHVEPIPTCYLRMAQSYVFVLREIRKILGDAAVDKITIDGRSLPDAAQQMVLLLAGMYLLSADDIGMAPSNLKDIIEEKDVVRARETAAGFLANVRQDPAYRADVRYIVPIMQEPMGKKARYWMTCGVRLTKIRAEYVKPPTVQLVSMKTGETACCVSPTNTLAKVGGEYVDYRFVPAEYFMPVEVFTEADSSKEPLTRAEFRALCDRCESVAEIEQAMQARLSPLRLGAKGTVVVIAGVVLAILTAIVVLLRRRGYILKLTRSAILHLTLLVLVSVCVFLVIQHRERQQALLLAVLQNRADDVRLLLEKHSVLNADATDENGSSLLQIACHNGNVEIARLLVQQGANVNADDDYASPLFIAAQYGNDVLFRLLLSHGAIPPTTKDGQARLIVAASACGSTDIVGILLAKGVPVDIQDQGGETALNVAVEGGHVAMVEFLLRNGAAIRYEDGHNPLNTACSYGHPDILKILVARGASVSGDALESAAYGRSLECMKLLLTNGPSDPTNAEHWIGGQAGIDALETACFKKDIVMVKFLISAGVKPDSPQAFLEAARQKSLDVMQLLLDNGADVNRAWHGELPLTMAMDSCSPESFNAVKFLLDKGADPNAVEERTRRSVFETACNYWHLYDIAELLMKYGAKGKMPDQRVDPKDAFRPTWKERITPRSLFPFLCGGVLLWTMLFLATRPTHKDQASLR